MNFEFFIHPETNDRHIYDHDVSEEEIEEAFSVSHFTQRRKDGSYMAYSRLKSGRYLKIIFRKLSNELYYIITAYDLEDQHMIDFIDQELEL